MIVLSIINSTRLSLSLSNAKHNLIPLYIGNPYMRTISNSEDPDEIPHDAAFHQGIHCLLR